MVSSTVTSALTHLSVTTPVVIVVSSKISALTTVSWVTDSSTTAVAEAELLECSTSITLPVRKTLWSWSRPAPISTVGKKSCTRGKKRKGRKGREKEKEMERHGIRYRGANKHVCRRNISDALPTKYKETYQPPWPTSRPLPCQSCPPK